jgi:hypothetical protein
MGLLDKTNPDATPRSLFLAADTGAISVPTFFFVLGKPEIRENWRFSLPAMAILGGAIGWLGHWQGESYDMKDDPPGGPNKTEPGSFPSETG